MYQKEIIYLGLYKDGDRLGSAGFLKVEKRDKDGNLSLVVKNVPHSINGKYSVRYYSGSEWKEADGITVREGGGQWEKQEPDSLERVRLQIMLPGGYLVEGISKEAARQAAAGSAACLCGIGCRIGRAPAGIGCYCEIGGRANCDRANCAGTVCICDVHSACPGTAERCGTVCASAGTTQSRAYCRAETGRQGERRCRGADTETPDGGGPGHRRAERG